MIVYHKRFAGPWAMAVQDVRQSAGNLASENSLHGFFLFVFCYFGRNS